MHDLEFLFLHMPFEELPTAIERAKKIIKDAEKLSLEYQREKARKEEVRE